MITPFVRCRGYRAVAAFPVHGTREGNHAVLEPMTGIEPAYSAWEAISSPERAFYTGWSSGLVVNSNAKGTGGFGPVSVRLQYGSGPSAVRSRRGPKRGTACAHRANRSSSPQRYPGTRCDRWVCGR